MEDNGDIAMWSVARREVGWHVVEVATCSDRGFYEAVAWG
jgi:hypothetical protein